MLEALLFLSGSFAVVAMRCYRKYMLLAMLLQRSAGVMDADVPSALWAAGVPPAFN
jgi:hypothetical protein